MKAKENWLYLMRGGQNNFSERILNDDCEKDFWKKFLADGKNTKKEEYTSKIFSEVLKIIKENNIQSILEIGIGWGNYTFDLAKNCKEIMCLDISQDAIDFVKKEAQKQNLNNISYINSKIEDAKLDLFDMSFAYNCFYRILDIEKTLEKIINSSKKISLIGMNSNIDRASTLDLENRLGLNIKKSYLNHKIIKEILLDMGYSCEEKIINVYREYSFDKIEDAYEMEKRFILQEKFSKKEVLNILEEHYNYSNGKFRQGHTICAGLLVIKKQFRRTKC